MARDKDTKGSYEMVDNQSLGKDLETGFPESSNPADSELLRNRFDALTSPSYNNSKFSLRGLKRRKYLVVLLILVVFFVATSGLYTSRNGLEILDYYKNKYSGSGDANPEAQNDQSDNNRGDQPVYNDNDEPLVDGAPAEGGKKSQQTKENSKADSTKDSQVVQNDGPVYEDNDEPLKGTSIKADGEVAESQDEAKSAPKAAVIADSKAEDDNLKITIEKEPEVEAGSVAKVETEEEIAKADQLKAESNKEAAEAK